MPGSIGSTRSLVLGLVLSVALHAGVGGVFARYGTFGVIPGLHPDQTPQPLTAPKPPEPLLTLGIDESKAATETWLGFAEPTEHSAPRAEVEQADLSPKPGAVSKPAPSQQASPPPSEPSTATEAPRQVIPPASHPASEPVLEPRADPKQASRRITAGTDKPAPEVSDQPVPDNEPVGPPAPLPSPEPSAPAAQPPQLSPGESAEQSEREATAAALNEAVDVKFGHPVAAKGLEIITVRPRWSITTQIVASPKNPVVRVTFGRNGRVLRAEFVKGQNTGWQEVDDPLLDALYRWRAKGAALGKIPADKKDAGLPIIFRITLKGE